MLQQHPSGWIHSRMLRAASEWAQRPQQVPSVFILQFLHPQKASFSFWIMISLSNPLLFLPPSFTVLQLREGRMETRASSLCQEDLSFGEKYTRAPLVQMQIFGKEKHLKEF